MYKSAPHLGGALGIALLGLFGFDPKLAQQSASGEMGLLLTFCVLPAALLLIATPLVWYFPIDARRQAIIARRLSRTARTSA